MGEAIVMCVVCEHPDRKAIDILGFQGYDEKAICDVLRGVKDLPRLGQLKHHFRLGHQRMDKEACIATITKLNRDAFAVQCEAEGARSQGEIWAYRSRSTMAMKTRLRCIELIARIEHLIQDGSTPSKGAIEEVFEHDPDLFGRLAKDFIERQGKKIVDVTPAPSVLARVTHQPEEAEVVSG